MQGEADGPDFEATKGETTDKLHREKQAAEEVLRDAGDEFVAKADEYASDAKDAIAQKAEGVQRDISANLTAFGGALRAASEHLANNDQRAASQFVLDAAGGLERLSSSLKNKPFEDVLMELRSFGRDNSGALIAGSVLAGLALGRFLKSSSPGASGADTATYGGDERAESSSAPRIDQPPTLSEPVTAPEPDQNDPDVNTGIEP